MTPTGGIPGWAVGLTFLVLGLLLIVIAVRYKPLAGKQVSISFDKMGFALRIDAVPFLILLAVILWGAPIAFLWREQDSRIEAAGKAEEKLNALRAQYDALRSYKMTVLLRFLENFEVSPDWAQYRMRPYVQRQGGKPEPLDDLIPQRAPGEDNNVAAVEVGFLQPGDKVSFEARRKEDQRMWVSKSNLTVPQALLDMRLFRK